MCGKTKPKKNKTKQKKQTNKLHPYLHTVKDLVKHSPKELSIPVLVHFSLHLIADEMSTETQRVSFNTWGTGEHVWFDSVIGAHKIQNLINRQPGGIHVKVHLEKCHKKPVPKSAFCFKSMTPFNNGGGEYHIYEWGTF